MILNLISIPAFFHKLMRGNTLVKVNYEGIANALRHLGLIPRGGFHPDANDDISAATVVLIGNAGTGLWQSFSGSKNSQDPLDDWCRAVLQPFAHNLGVDILFPFDGPPYYPFISWAKRAEGLSSSPIGPLIHPCYGLWHAYRGALLFPYVLEVPVPLSTNPCESCSDKPCLVTCPVGALGVDGYKVSTCVGHIKTPPGDDCLGQGCRARRVCPVGQEYLYAPEQAAFHMEAFLRNY